MSTPPPTLDERTAEDIVAQLVILIEQYTTSPGGSAAPYPFPPWKEYDPATLQPTGISAALVGVFARFAELVIQRINQVPDKNFRAFLDLLGAARLPPEPARVPLTFSLAAGRTNDAVVPAGTKVAAQPAQGDTGPIVFEVEQQLVVTAAQLVSLVTFDPEQDTYADWSSLNTATSSPFLAFQGAHAVEHVLYIGDDRLLAYPRIQDLRVLITLAQELPSAEPRTVQWEQWDGAGWVPLSLESDGTANLTRSSTVDFGLIQPLPQSVVDSRPSRWLRCRLLTPITLSPDKRGGMVRASQLPTIAALALAVDVGVDVAQTPANGLTADSGFSNGVPLDLTKEFFPFGERPKLYDALYLSSLEGFSKDPTSSTADTGAKVQLNVQVANSHLGTAPNSVKPSADLELVWECSTRDGWTELGRGKAPPELGKAPLPPTPNAQGFADGTFGFCQSGLVTLRLPDTFAKATVNGQENHWLRVRLVKGDYGKDAQYELRSPPPPPAEPTTADYIFRPASFRPPIISTLKIGYRFTAQRAPEVCRCYNHLTFQDVTALAASEDAVFAPFTPLPDQQRPGLFLGFSLPPRQSTFPNTTLSLYASLAAAKYGERLVPVSPDVTTLAGLAQSKVTHRFVVTNTSDQETLLVTAVGDLWTARPSPSTVGPGETADIEVEVSIPDNAKTGESDRGFLQVRTARDPEAVHAASFVTAAGLLPSPMAPRLAWQYWNGSSWLKLTVRDGSEGFTRSGPVEFLAPRDFTRSTLFGRERYWLRVLWDQGEYSVQPRLRQLLLNTTAAVQTLTTRNEILGSSTGGKAQTFHSTRVPVLKGQRLEVREPELPSAEEQSRLRAEEGDDAITVVADAAGRPREIWVRWHEVPDFYGSGPRDRHYVMNHLTGEIRFGDGVSGRIPPIGASNLRLARYQSGGGSSANRAAGSVTQLKTTVPYIEKVTNPEPAAGGAEAEPMEALYERMPRTLRHRDRAVTSEDYEDLAALASPEVARSSCVPLRDLNADPLGNAPRYGMVSVIVVPRTSDEKPQPTLELLSRVRSFLERRTPADAGLAVVGPLYVRVDVRAEVAVSSLDDSSAVERAVQERLAAFLHPLTGGLDARGWDFGRAPHRSDFLALIEGTPGVDHVRFLQIDETEDLTGIRLTGRFLVYSGKHQIDLAFEET